LWIALQQTASSNCQTAHGGTKTGTQDGIDKELRTVQEAFATVTGEVGFFRNDDRRHREPLQHDLHFAMRRSGVPQDHDRDGTAGFYQIARRDQAVTAVIAFAAQDYDAPAQGEFPQNEAGRGAPGVLHQFQRRDPEAVGTDPIGHTHLGGGQ
jgi:hypothetical protein